MESSSLALVAARRSRCVAFREARGLRPVARSNSSAKWYTWVSTPLIKCFVVAMVMPQGHQHDAYQTCVKGLPAEQGAAHSRLDLKHAERCVEHAEQALEHENVSIEVIATVVHVGTHLKDPAIYLLPMGMHMPQNLRMAQRP